MKFGIKTILRARRWLAMQLLVAVGMIDHRRYMRLFIKLMRARGMNIDGTPRYISPRAIIDSTDYGLIHLSDGCVVSSGVRILTHDFSIDRVIRDEDGPGAEYFLTDEIHIGRRCFVGAGSILLPGTRLGHNVIVGAGSVVRGTIEPNKVIVGNPAIAVGDSAGFLAKNRSRAKAHD